MYKRLYANKNVEESDIIMSKQIIKLLTENGKVYATSREVAGDFEKEHYNVTRDIENLLKIEPLKNEGLKYFIPCTYFHRGNEYKQYKLTKDGFTLLAMGFTGSKAIQFKIDYMNKFNEMEAQLNDITEVMNTKGEMSLDDWNEIRFSIRRTKNTFADSNVDDIKQLVNEFIDYAIDLDTKTRVVRCDSAMKGLQELHNKVAKESTLNIAECYKILQYIDNIKNIKHMAENRHRGQKIAHRNKKIKTLENKAM